MADEDSIVYTVSSLRSRFEQLMSPTTPSADWDSQRGRLSNASSARATPSVQRGEDHVKEHELQDPFAELPSRRVDGRDSLDLPSRDRGLEKGLVDTGAGAKSFSQASKKWEHESQSSTNHLAPPSRPVPKQRPLSMGMLSPPRNPPTLRVDSPKSPAQPVFMQQPGVGKSKTPPPAPPPRDSQRSSRPASPTREGGFKAPPPIPTATRPSRPAALNIWSVENSGSRNEYSITTPTPRGTPLSPFPQTLQDHASPNERIRTNEPSPTPPPVPNRPERYRAAKKVPPVPAKKSDNLAVTQIPSDERVSPFSTPPSSPEKSHESSDERSAAYFARMNAVKRVSLNSATFATPPPPPPPPPLPPPTLPPHPSVPPPPPVNLPMQARASMAISSPGYARLESSRLTANPPPMTRASIDSSELRPTLPPRPRGGLFGLHTRKNSLRGRSASPPRISSSNKHMAFEATPQVDFMPPPQRSQTIKARSPTRQEHGHRSVSSLTSGPTFVPTSSRLAARVVDSDEEEAGTIEQDRLSEYPDASQANRRKPLFRTGPHEIHCKTDVRLFAVSGQYVCTASHHTRVWNVSTGECIMSLNHGETTKITAIAFKPSVDVLDEGTVLWLGTSNGELLEVDIATQRIVESRASAHTKKEIVKIHRHRYELWTLDEGGKLQIWAPDPNGLPNLRNSPTTIRIPNKHTYSLVVGSELWIGAGRNVYVYAPTSPGSPDVLGRPLSPCKPTGEITCGTVVNSEPDKVFFGHSDGKVSIYSRSTLQCIDVVSVSLYKINSMCGVGDYLWTGFKTGMVYVYDVRTKPWRVIKDWQAHEDPIVEVVGDRTSIWKVDRLQVISLATDNIIKVWDGMLEEDWLEAKMVKHDMEFCSFREIKAIICTWNAGASKPQDLLNDKANAAFLENVLSSIDSPDIIVFGFQELVDLEDKKITAKSLLKTGKKKKAQATQERMSHQYRLWQKQLTKSIEQFMPRKEPYYLLHSANLVGLFTCIFIKQSERNNIRDIAASTVKRGLGGLHGNKGALVVRFLLDDSSLCFINCHLAAGQSHTISRNNDIAAILESASLPAETDKTLRSDIFVGGGDGSMILDHEICVLNGDLNYRIDGNRESIIHKVKMNDLDSLLERDQLLVERKRNPGFRLRVFQESPIRFAPTYKYDVGTDEYDTSEKKRSPAWCDRLLYRGLGRIKQLEYRRHEVNVSDHRPVSGVFLVRLKTVDPAKKAVVWKWCMEEYRKVKQDMLREAKLDFLISVCGYEREEAERLLKDKILPEPVRALQG